MVDLNITLVIQMVNFLVALVIINFLIIKPIRAALQRRRELTGKFIQQTESSNEEAERRVRAYEAELDKVRAKAQAHKEMLRKQGQDKSQALMANAQQQAQDFLQGARKSVADESNAAMQTLRAQVDTLAGHVAARLIRS